MSQMVNGEKHYSVKEVAAIVGVHYLTIYKWLDLRRISYFKFSERKTLIPKSALDAFIQSGSVKTII